MPTRNGQIFLYHDDAFAEETLAMIGQTRWLALYAVSGAGLTTFLRADLVHAARSAGWAPLYISEFTLNAATLLGRVAGELLRELCWQRHALDPSQGEAQAIDRWESLAASGGAASVLDREIPAMVSLLRDLASRPVLLVLDGWWAVEVLADAYEGLIDLHDHYGVGVVLASSRRDGLSWLQAQVGEDPGRGPDGVPLIAFRYDPQRFATQINEHITPSLAPDNRFTTEALARAFVAVGCRPGLLWVAIRHVALELGLAADLEALLDQEHEILPEDIWESTFDEMTGLTRLQRVVLVAADEHIRRHGGAYSPFAQDSCADLRRRLRVERLPVSSVQKAVKSLRQRGYLWRTPAGGYGVEETLLIEHLRNTRGAACETERVALSPFAGQGD